MIVYLVLANVYNHFYITTNDKEYFLQAKSHMCHFVHTLSLKSSPRQLLVRMAFTRILYKWNNTICTFLVWVFHSACFWISLCCWCQLHILPLSLSSIYVSYTAPLIFPQSTMLSFISIIFFLASSFAWLTSDYLCLTLDVTSLGSHFLTFQSKSALAVAPLFFHSALLFLLQHHNDLVV